jgi:hypothetical protein
MKNNDSLLVANRWIVYRGIVKDVVKLDVDNVVRVYKKCESIDEGLLG